MSSLIHVSEPPRVLNLVPAWVVHLEVQHVSHPLLYLDVTVRHGVPGDTTRLRAVEGYVRSDRKSRTLVHGGGNKTK